MVYPTPITPCTAKKGHVFVIDQGKVALDIATYYHRCKGPKSKFADAQLNLKLFSSSKFFKLFQHATLPASLLDAGRTG